MNRAMGVLVMIVVVGGFGYWLGNQQRAAADSDCVAAVEEVELDEEQLTNATTIAQVGMELEMPDRAVVVALAAAMQESGLRNLDYGDRDSLGLFQQRPSQGWGSPEQVQDPRYAADKFYRALRRVDGWPEMRVTDAAQAVQRSAFPEAYQQWAGDADLLATELLRCRD
jgi:hypothetical protein